ncbi:hypothetical protein F1880_005739 [Penicillium rolfsii]|nr:hypothetical protein F1880_005739 [Penicillium rolfsii]
MHPSTFRSSDRSNVTRNRFYRVHRSQITKWEPRRTFSGSKCAQIIIIDDEEEVEALCPPHILQPSLNKPRAVHRNMNELIRTRELREKQRACQPLDRKKIQEIEKRARVLDNGYKLSDEFLQLKYAHAEHCLSWSANSIAEIRQQYYARYFSYISHLEESLGQMQRRSRHLEHEYCKIAFRFLGNFKQQLSFSDRNILKLRIDVFSQSLRISDQFIKNLHTRLDKEYLQARNSARARIDKILAHAEIVADQYNELQARSMTVSSGLTTITTLLQSLVNLDSRKESTYKPFVDANDSIANTFSRVSHMYRYRWRLSRRHENPLGGAFLLEYSNRVGSDTPAPGAVLPSKAISALMFDDRAHQKTRARMEKGGLRVANVLRRPYLQRWKGPKPSQSTQTNRYWRQLDILAPFDIQRMYYARLSKDLLYLTSTFQAAFGPMWDGLDPPSRRSHQTRLTDWHKIYKKQQKEFLKELEMYRYINWYRLEVDERLAKLGVPNLIQAQGLFIASEPLSQDIGRFHRWIHQMADLSFQGWVSETAFRMIREPSGPEKWLQLTKKFHEHIAGRKSQILDLGTVRVRRRGVSQKRAKISRLSNSKKNVRHKTARRVRPKPASATWGRSPTKETPNPRNKLKSKRSSKFSSAKSDVKKPQASKPNPQKNFISRKRKVARSRLEPTAVWDDLGPAKEFRPKPAPADAKTRFREAMTMKSELRSHHTSDKPKKTESWREKIVKTGQPLEATSVKPDTSAKREPPLVGKPNLSAKRNFWDPNPVARSGGISQRFKFKGRPYSTGSTTISDHTLDCNHNALPDTEPCYVVQPPDTHAKLPISAEDAYHLEVGSTSNQEVPLFWRHSDQQSPNGQRPIVHYCKSLESTETVARLFLNSKVVGFDMEWKAQASATDSIQNNLSLIQIANEERIALFQIALFKPARSLEDFVAPSLRRIIESPDITKVGVSIKADSTRLRKFLGVEAKSIFELSYLYKLVKYGEKQPKLVNRRTVNLSDQVEEYLGLPLEKSEDVRCGDWARSLNYRQVQYAATDPYACICLFNVMEQKRQAMNPIPPRPAHAELNLPIICPTGEAVNVEDKDLAPGIIDGDVIDCS